MPTSNKESKTLRDLVQWFSENKITYNEEAIKLVDSTAAVATTKKNKTSKPTTIISDGIGIVAQRDLIDEEPLVVIPKEAVISPATSPLANIFEDEEISGSLALCISVMYEFSLGSESPWFGYLNSLPKNADIPLLWPESAQKWLASTDLGLLIESDLAGLKEDFGVLQKLVADYPGIFLGRKWTDFEHFLDVTSLVSSRAFMVDVYRGNSMVPFADLFNHKTAKENVHIESEEMVCPLCGEAFGCEHMDGLAAASQEDGYEDESDGSSEGDEDEDEEGEDMGEELPLLVDENGKPIADSSANAASSGKDDGSDSGEDDEDDAEWESDDSEDRDGEDKWEDTLDMVVYRTCSAGTEVFNTYGEHSSSYLLHRYGFCDTNNPFDSVAIGKCDILEGFKAAVSEKRASDIENVIDRYPEIFAPHHRAKSHDDGEDDEEQGDEEGYESDCHGSHSENEEDSEDGSIGEDEIPMMDGDDDDEGKDEASFTIDAPGHPTLALAALLTLGLSEELAFAQTVESSDILKQYFFPAAQRFWTVFQEKLDAGASATAAFREASTEVEIVKKTSAAMVCKAVYVLSEKRLEKLKGEPESKPTGSPAMCSRWERAMQLRSNEKKVLLECIKTYKKAANKLSN